MPAFGADVTVTFRLDPRWRQLEQEFQQVVEIAARHVEANAKERMAEWPAVDTGATMNSISATQEDELAWRVGPTTEYAPFIEYGTRYMTARPFLIPAVEGEMPRLEQALSQLMQRLQ